MCLNAQARKRKSKQIANECFFLWIMMMRGEMVLSGGGGGENIRL